MDWNEYRDWLDQHRPKRRVYVEVTVTDILPTNLPAVEATPAGPTRNQLYPELVTAAGVWRKHYHRCPPGQRCRREHMEWIDMLLDEWLQATH